MSHYPYENDITNSSKTNDPLTIVETCWLSPANHQSPFIPLSDPFLQYYRDQPSNPILAINCYNSRKTQFIVEEQVQKFVDWVSILQGED